MKSGKFHKAEDEDQGDYPGLLPPLERDDDDEDEFIEVSILDGLSVDELPPPTTLFREEDGKLIEVSIFGNINEDEPSPPATRTRNEELHEAQGRENSVSLPVVPNPPPTDTLEDEHQSPSLSIKKEEEEEEDPIRITNVPPPTNRDDDSDSEYTQLRPPPPIKKEDSESGEEEEKEVSPPSEVHPPPPPKPTPVRDEEFQVKEEDEVDDSEYLPLIKEEDSESDEEETKKSKKRRKPTRRKKKRKNRPRWTSSQFPSEKDEEGEYYCADCERGNDVIRCRNCRRKCWRWCNGEKCEKEGYYERISHKCFKSLPRKKRTYWNSVLFPKEKTSAGDYYCADCERGNDVQKCRNCLRFCWRWCDGEECQEEEGYKEYSRHKCFESKKKRKNRLNWKREDFPQEKEAKYYCGDCESSREAWKCSECGRRCWKCCQNCGEYRPRQHVPCTKKKKRKRKRKREEKKTEKEGVEKLEPSKKKRKLE